MSRKPGDPTAFEAVVDDYDAARPTYPDALYDALPPLGRCLELGAGTGLATVGLRPDHLVVTDLGPAMLARGLTKHEWPGVVCRAEELPFADTSFDTVFGAQMWHWVDKPAGPLEVRRVLRPGGQLLLCWNETRNEGLDWFERQQDRIEAGNPLYQRGYREIDYNAQLGEWFSVAPPQEFAWERGLSYELYGRWLRSKSYVQRLPDVDGFVRDSLSDLRAVFGDGPVVEPFVARLWRFTVR